MFNNNYINCNYNSIFTKFNEIVDYKKNFYSNIKYPSFHNLKNCNSNISTNVLNNLNNTIKLEIDTFRTGMEEEEKEINKVDQEQKQPLVRYRLISDYMVTFNKSFVLSNIINLMTFVDTISSNSNNNQNNTINNNTNNTNIKYNELYDYNIDLTTGKTIFLKDVFVPNIDYKTVITNYIKYKINQNKQMFFENSFIEIVNDQAFYLTDEALVIYFEAGTLAPENFGTIKFRMEYKKFLPYIRPKFYCTPQNLVM